MISNGVSNVPGIESNRIEYKREIDKGDKLEKALVSFLNYNGGGEIYIGIADDGSVFGISDADGDQRKIADRLGNNIRPKILGLFDVIVEKAEGKNIIRIVVSSGMQKPYYIRKKGITPQGCFIRVSVRAFMLVFYNALLLLIIHEYLPNNSVNGGFEFALQPLSL